MSEGVFVPLDCLDCEGVFRCWSLLELLLAHRLVTQQVANNCPELVTNNSSISPSLPGRDNSLRKPVASWASIRSTVLSLEVCKSLNEASLSGSRTLVVEGQARIPLLNELLTEMS